MKVTDVDDECNIYYDDDTIIICPYRPTMTFEDCTIGYGSHGECQKWNFNHLKESEKRNEMQTL
jgi:hypothetical protein